MKKLTDAEEEVMQILWKVKEAFVKDLLNHYETPRPAYNTVSTIIRILEKKGFVDHKAYGKSHMYYPLISKDRYKKYIAKNLFKDYFDNSFQKIVSHFSEEEKLSKAELEELKSLIKKMEK